MLSASPISLPRLVALTAVLLGGGVALAQGTGSDSTAEEPEPLPVYRVELLVFEYLSAMGAEEDWSADPQRELTSDPPPQPDPNDTLSFIVTDERFVDDMTAGDDLPADEDRPPELRYRLVAADARLLGDAVSRMRASRDYRPLLHAAWEQPGYERGTAPPLDIVRVNDAAPRLSGTVALSLARYLHLDVALDLDPESAVATERMAGLEADAPVYQLRESRRMRSRELHFLDHPKFGVLVRIDPVEIPEPVADTSAEAVRPD